MDFTKIIPLTDIEQKEHFTSCRTLSEFLDKVLTCAERSTDPREKISFLAVYMAFRDHYPSYLAKMNPVRRRQLDTQIEEADPKIIKLRRIALSELSKVV